MKLEIRARQRLIAGSRSLAVACVALLLSGADVSAITQASPGDKGARLEKLVLLMRHGVRSPTRGSDELGAYSAEAWPVWPVAPGELTPHGAVMAAAMGAHLRDYYSRLGLLPTDTCPASSALFIWSDGADQRTRASGDAIARGLGPGCDLVAEHATADSADPLFGSPLPARCTIDPALAQAAILARAGGDLDRLGQPYTQARTALAKILSPAADGRACAGSDDRRCLIASGRNSLRASGQGTRLEGPLAAGSTISESLLLEYAEGLPAEQVGWGRAASEATLAEIMPLHDLYADLMRRTPYLAARHGAALARQILSMLDPHDEALGTGHPRIPAGTRMVVLVGHDTNLSNIAGLLDIDWSLPGQPDKTAPDTTLAIELWRRPQDDTRFVRLVVHYQTLAGLRTGAVAEAASLPISLPACGKTPDGTCPLGEFSAKLSSALAPGCAG